ncbi:MAG: CHAT domain-containing protein [Chloroflexota bacterium]
MTVPSVYADLEIRIGKQDELGYPVELTLNSEQEFAGGHLPLDFLPWVAGTSSAEDGQRLFDWLASDDAFKRAWGEIRGQYPQRRLRLRLDVDAPELHTLPWELLRDEDGVAAQDLAATSATPFSRYLAGRWLPGSPILKRPIKILLAVANPENLAEFELTAVEPEAEQNSFEAALAEVEGIETTVLEQPCTLTALEAALREGYHIVHLIAHGQYSKRRQQTVLYLADDSNQVALVNGQELADMLTRQLADLDAEREEKLRLVFLASCQTATHNPADAFRAVGPALVAAGVPAVLAMQDLVPIETAQAFSQVFYRQLMQHGQVDLASNEARATLMTAKLPGAVIPVLFLRQRGGQLLGQTGRITSSSGDQSAETFWPFLMEQIFNAKCTPFLGPDVNRGLLPSPGAVAEILAEKYQYPLPDRRNLTSVAQFTVLNAGEETLRQAYLETLQRGLYTALRETPPQRSRRDRRRDNAAPTSLSQLITNLNWAERVLETVENPIHHLLADIEFPLYITTNTDSLLVEAIRRHQTQQREAGERERDISVRRAGPRWQRESNTSDRLLTPDPSLDDPVVYHLLGYDDNAEQVANLVLSEDDFLTYFATIVHDQDDLIQTNVLDALAENTFLFLGYHLDDWAFRVVLQGLLKQIAQTTTDRRPHVGVQLTPNDAPQAQRTQDYLSRYMGAFNINIYWGTPQQFVSELHHHWQAYLAEGDAA